MYTFLVDNQPVEVQLFIVPCSGLLACQPHMMQYRYCPPKVYSTNYILSWQKIILCVFCIHACFLHETLEFKINVIVKGIERKHALMTYTHVTTPRESYTSWQFRKQDVYNMQPQTVAWLVLPVLIVNLHIVTIH